MEHQVSKRGRPKKVVTDQVEFKEPKKRGRKKKDVTEDVASTPKKRGRKPAVKYYSSTIRKKFAPLTNIIDDTANYIIQLNINDNEQGNSPMVQKIECANECEDNTCNKYKIKECDSGDSDDSDDIGDSEDSEDSDSNDILVELKNLYNKRIEKRIKDDEKIKKSIETIDFNPIDAESLEQENENDDVSINSKLMKWETKTKSKCWWCVHEFDSLPLGLPVYYDIRIEKYRVRGTFCSFPCMLAYSDSMEFKSKYRDICSKTRSMVSALHQRLTGINLKDNSLVLKKAPCRYMLNTFGGKLTIDEFRNAGSQGKIYRMVEYPMYVSRDFLETVDAEKLKNDNKSYIDDFNKNVQLDSKLIEDAKQRLNMLDTSSNIIDKYFSKK